MAVRTDGSAAQVHEVPVVRHAVLARVLAHGRDEDAVMERDGAQREGRKELRRHPDWPSARACGCGEALAMSDRSYLPSPSRALALDKAYRVLVERQLLVDVVLDIANGRIDLARA